MKLAIKIGNASLLDGLILSGLAKVLREFMSDGHWVILVHGGRPPVCSNGGNNQNGKNDLDACDCVLGSARLNHYIVASLGRVGIQAIGIFADENLAKTRIRLASPLGPHMLEVACLDPFWIDTICRSGGVPVIANVAMTVGQSDNCVSPDQMAAACAIAWRANALVFLTRGNGVQDGEGRIMRWLDVDQVRFLAVGLSVPPALLPRLLVCRDALKQGVHRVRIFPLSQLCNLTRFFAERLDCGTEVILRNPADNLGCNSVLLNA